MTVRPLLLVSEVDLHFGNYHVLQNVSLRLAAGEVLTLVGLNGSGKTTLLRVILGLQRPDYGRVELNADRIGYMPQRLSIDDTLPLTVLRLLKLAGGRRFGRARAAAALAEVGAEQVIDSPLQAISGGELQRVLLARALARDPQLLVLDEPVQSVDVAGQYELYRLLGQIRKQRGCAILMVSHDLHLVMPTTDRVVCLNHHVCCSGPPELVSQHPAYRQLFGLPADQPLAVYRHRHDHQHDARGDIIGN